LREVWIGDRRLCRRLTREIGSADELQKVAIAPLVLHQQHDPVRIGKAALRPASLRVAVAIKGDLAADDRLNARCGAGGRDLKRTEQIAGIGDRHRGHAFGLAQGDQLLCRDRPGR